MTYFISIELHFLRNDLLSNELNTQQICKYSNNRDRGNESFKCSEL